MTQKHTELGKALKQAREAEGIFQKDVANRLDCSQAYIHKCELGYVGILKFAEILGTLGYEYTIQIRKK